MQKYYRENLHLIFMETSTTVGSIRTSDMYLFTYLSVSLITILILYCLTKFPSDFKIWLYLKFKFPENHMGILIQCIEP